MEKIIEIYKGAKYSTERYSDKSVLAKRETNDCVVRAFASAFDISYEDAHVYIKEKFGRRDRKGTMNTVGTLRGVKSVFKKKVEEQGMINPDNLERGCGDLSKQMIWIRKNGKVRNYTTGSFIKDNPTGTYFILVRYHAFCIKDGVVFGNSSDARQIGRRIKQAFKIS